LTVTRTDFFPKKYQHKDFSLTFSCVVYKSKNIVWRFYARLSLWPNEDVRKTNKQTKREDEIDLVTGNCIKGLHGHR